MKKVIIAVLIIIALLSVTSIGMMINNSNREAKEEIENEQEGKRYAEVNLPEVSVYFAGDGIGKLQGYTIDMDTSLLRDNLSVTTDGERSVRVSISESDYKTTGVTYELRSIDGERLIDSGEITDFNGESFDIGISSIAEVNQEYMLTIILGTSDLEAIKYYTRVMVLKDDVISKQLEFAKQFSECTVDGEGEINIVTYMEPDANLANNSLGTVTLANNYSLITWGDLNITKKDRTEISLAEVYVKDTGVSGTYILRYQAEALGNNEITDTYDVEERITVWTFNEQQYVLAYERQTNQVWSVDQNTVRNSFIDLGIQKDINIDFTYSPNNQFLSYTVNGQIWLADLANREFTKIHAVNKAHSEIMTSTVYDDGSVDFVSCGYSIQSTHAGQNGISVYHYDKNTNTVRELVFIQNNTPKELLASQIKELCFINDDVIYIKINDGIYYINIATKETGTMVEGLTEGNYAINASKDTIAYNTEKDMYDSNSITIIKFLDGSRTEKQAGEGNKIRVCGYAYNNLVYGVAKAKNANEKKNRFAMSTLTILDEDLAEVKSYSQKKVLITDIDILDTVIKLHREKNGVAIDDDQLIDNTEKDSGAATASYYDDTKKKREAAISLTTNLNSNMETKVLDEPTKLLSEETIELQMTDENISKYYVYSIGKLSGVYQNRQEAEMQAKAGKGIVTDSTGEKIWTFEENYE